MPKLDKKKLKNPAGFKRGYAHKWAATILFTCFSLLIFSKAIAFAADKDTYGTASLMVIVERESGSVIVIDSSRHKFLGRVSGLGNLTHATVKFSKDARFAYVIARDASVSKIDLLSLKLVKKVRAGEDSVGGVMTQDGKYIALSNYLPGEVRILDAETLETVKTIPAEKELPDGKKVQSRVVGLLDAPGNLLIFSLMDGNATWIVDAGKKDFPVIKRFHDVGEMPYDALITPDGRFYLVGLLNSNWVGLLDTWEMSEVKKISTIRTKEARGAGDDAAPLWKIPHLKGWAIAGDYAVLPAIRREVALVYNTRDWSIVKEVPLVGTALYTVAGPDGRYVWVDLVGKNGDIIQVIDLKTLEVVKTFSPGKGATHPQFTPKGDAVYISLMDEDKIVVYDPLTFKKIKEFPAKRPSGIFSTERAHKFGM
ncbi:MAG: protein nirF [Deltaproteobacteria bacterium]|nr:protein nirF [Deltaproteobacteria bacterium]